MMLTKIRYPLFYTLLIIISRPYEQMCPGVIVHPFSGIIAWTCHSTDQHLLSSAWPDILCDSHILLGISLPVLFTWSSGWPFLLILQQGQSLWFLSGWFQSLVEALVFLHSLQVLLAEHFKIVADFEPWQSSQVDENPEFLWCKTLVKIFPLTVKF